MSSHGKRMVCWRGTSQFDGIAPIVMLATYGKNHNDSNNAKTGSMVQTWILRADMEPYEAVVTGADAAICGTCPHRSGGACYVRVDIAPTSVYRAWRRDGTRVTPAGRPTSRGDSLPFDPSVFAGRLVRFGAYGDPAAVPLEIWDQIATAARRVTGYTHAWQTCDPGYARYCMASVDRLDEWPQAKAAGYRSFIVRPAGSFKPAGAVQCPASVEAGHKATCATCLQCGGTSNGRTADVSIEAHGSKARRFWIPVQRVSASAVIAVPKTDRTVRVEINKENCV